MEQIGQGLKNFKLAQIYRDANTDQSQQNILKQGFTESRTYQSNGFELIHLRGYLNLYRQKILRSSSIEQWYELDEIKCKISIYKDMPHSDLNGIKYRKQNEINKINTQNSQPIAEINLIEKISDILNGVSIQQQKKDISQNQGYIDPKNENANNQAFEEGKINSTSQASPLNSQNEKNNHKNKISLTSSISHLPSLIGFDGKKKVSQIQQKDDYLAQMKTYQEILLNDPSLIDKIIEQIISKSKKDSKRFTIYFGASKYMNNCKLVAHSEIERNLWVNAISLMIKYNLKIGFMQVQPEQMSEKMVKQNSQGEIKNEGHIGQEQVKGSKKGIISWTIGTVGSYWNGNPTHNKAADTISSEGQISESTPYRKIKSSNTVKYVQKAVRGGINSLSRSKKNKNVQFTVKNHKDNNLNNLGENVMTLNQMSDYLSGQESEFQLQVNKMSEIHQQFLINMNKLEEFFNEPSNDQAKPVNEFEVTKKSSKQLLSCHIDVLNQFKQIRGDLHQIIEQLAEREQSVDLQAFLKRESVIPKNNINDATSAMITARQFFSIDDDTHLKKVSSNENDNLNDINENEQQEAHESLQFQDPENQDENIIIENQDQQKSDQDQISEQNSQKVSSDQEQEEEYFHNNDEDEEQEVDSDLEDIFMDAIDEIQEASINLNKFKRNSEPKNNESMQEQEILNDSTTLSQTNQLQISNNQYLNEPKERSQLPWFKDPKLKISIWTVIRDSIGKDISKLTVPVFFNGPFSLLQQCAISMEYSDIIDHAALIKDKYPSRRLAMIAIYASTQYTGIERSYAKPFNPLLGETYELINDNFEFLSEQVSHHPPITANYCKGKKTGYILWSNQQTNTMISGKGMEFVQQYRSYIEFPNHNEQFEIIAPNLSIHNLIVGSPYMDIGGTMKIRVIGNDELDCQVRFIKRGWFSKEAFKLEGEVTRTVGKKIQYLHKIIGHWNSNIYLIDYLEDSFDSKSQNLDESTKVCIFKKNPYPENWDYQYGMSHFGFQVNYFPSWLKDKVAPTDTRRRPDQRLLEEGEMMLASQEKDRLEVKQRQARKLNEQNNIHHKPNYFVEFQNPHDGQTYYVYNKLYFEHDRPFQKWERLPNIFND